MSKLIFKWSNWKQGSVIISVLIVSAIYISQESQVHQRISELRKEGQWSASRLPKLVEASRPKSHWDYLLEEMQWMAADFAQERRWKEAAAKKVWIQWNNTHRELWNYVSTQQNENYSKTTLQTPRSSLCRCYFEDKYWGWCRHILINPFWLK